MIWPLLCLLLWKSSLQLATINSVSASNTNINQVAVYTWNITFDSTTARSPLTITFPSALTLSGSSAITVNSTNADSVSLTCS